MTMNKTQYKVGDLVKHRGGDRGIVLEAGKTYYPPTRSWAKVYWLRTKNCTTYMTKQAYKLENDYERIEPDPWLYHGIWETTCELSHIQLIARGHSNDSE